MVKSSPHGKTPRVSEWIRQLKKEKDAFRRKLKFLGHFFGELKELGVDAYLVGGQAVEIYTGGQFSTGDVDITAGNREEAAKLLLRLGFKKTGMIWLREDLGIAVQIVGARPSSTEKARTLVIDGSDVKVVGVEDLVIDRLVSSKYWRSNPKLDLEQAAVLVNEFRDSLDLKYLRTRADEEHVVDYLNTISTILKKPPKDRAQPFRKDGQGQRGNRRSHGEPSRN